VVKFLALSVYISCEKNKSGTGILYLAFLSLQARICIPAFACFGHIVHYYNVLLDGFD